MTIRDIYLPSLDAEGKTWRIYYYKPAKGPGVVCATEGTSETTPEGTSFFKCVLFESRRYRHTLTQRATKRGIAVALTQLLRVMKDDGVVPPERVDALLAQTAAI